AALSGLRGATGCPPRSPARPHGVHNQTRVAPPSVPGPAHPPVSEAVSATPPKTCRAGWVTAAAMDGRGSECVQEVRPSGRAPPGAARLRTKPADTGPLSPTAHAGWASATTSYGSGARVERLPGCGLRPLQGYGARLCPGEHVQAPRCGLRPCPASDRRDDCNKRIDTPPIVIFPAWRRPVASLPRHARAPGTPPGRLRRTPSGQGSRAHERFQQPPLAQPPVVRPRGQAGLLLPQLAQGPGPAARHV